MDEWYKSLDTGEKVKIVSDMEHSYMLNNGSKILKKAFADKYSILNNNTDMTTPSTLNEGFSMNESHVDPTDFFSPGKFTVQGLDILDRIDTSRISDGPGDGGISYSGNPFVSSEPTRTDPMALEAEKRRLIEKYNNNNVQQIPQQPVMGSTFINEDDEDAVNSIAPPRQQSRPTDDPSYNFFKSAKRNHDMVVKFEFETKISNPSFVKMMAENLEGDFIKYYVDDFMNVMMADTARVRKIVYDQIYKEIYGDPKPKKTKQQKVVPQPVQEPKRKYNKKQKTDGTDTQ